MESVENRPRRSRSIGSERYDNISRVNNHVIENSEYRRLFAELVNYSREHN